MIPRIFDWLYYNYNNEYTNLIECGFDNNTNISSNYRIINNIQLILIFELELWLTFIIISLINYSIIVLLILFYFSIIEIIITGK